MRFTVSSEISAEFPSLRIAVFYGIGLDNQRNGDSARLILEEEQENLRRSHTPDSLTSDHRIVAWRDTYTKLGQKRFRPAAESFAKYMLRNNDFSSISPIVDIYLAAQLRFLIPIGGYDVDRINGDLELRRTGGGETFHAIGSDSASLGEVTDPGEIVYADDSRVLTRRWNWKDSEDSKITSSTKNIVLMVEAPSFKISDDELLDVVKYMNMKMSSVCGGFYWFGIFNPQHDTEIDFSQLECGA